MPDNTELTWDMVPEKEIQSELAFWKAKGADAIWLVPSRYEDGEVTCSGSVCMPYSNPLRRHYQLHAEWQRLF